MLFLHKNLQRDGQKGDRSTLQKSKRIRAVTYGSGNTVIFVPEKSRL